MSPRSRRSASPSPRPVLRRAGRAARLLGVVVLAVALTGPTALAASATVPGTPGVTQPGTPVYTEDFSNQNASLTAIDIRAYRGGPAAANSTYTADTQWTPDGQQCNGWIMSSTTLLPGLDLGCARNQPDGWRQLREMAVALGTAQGMTPAQAAANQVLTEYTNASSGTIAAGVEFQTRNTITGTGGHYYAVSAYFAATSCPAGNAAHQPSERFSLIVNGTPTVLSTGLNPCTNSTDWGPQVTKLQSAAYMVPTGTTANLGLSLYNAQTSGAGNDVAFDLPQIVDVTPQLDKAFSPAVIRTGATSTLTLTVTNTSDLMAKTDWFLTDALPANLRIAAVPNVGGTCTQRAGAAFTVSASANGATVGVTGGDLAQGQASCTITVAVTSAVGGTYVNGPANITTNLNPPANASLEVIQPSIDLVKTITAVNGAAVDSDADPDRVYTRPGDVVTYAFVATNTTPKAPTNTALNTSLTNVRISEDAFSGIGDMSTLSCAPAQGSTLASGARMTCSATYVVQQGDVDAGDMSNRARATGTPAAGANVTDTDDETIPAVWTTSLLLDKSAAVVDVDGDGVTGLGDHIRYTFAVTNTGSVTLSGVAIADDLLAAAGIGVTCAPTTLAPGKSATCAADEPYEVTQDDVDATEVVNTATATGKDPKGRPVVSPPDSTLTPVELFRIALRVEKIGEDVTGDWVRMDGSSFALLADDGGAPGAPVAVTWIDVETGLFEIAALPAGTYWLSELTAPDGFSLLAEPVPFTVMPDRTVALTGDGGGAVTASGRLLTVRDVPAFRMPETGGTGATPYLAGGGALVVAAAALAVIARRRTRAPRA